jgi:hypothetical protein
MKLKGFLEVVSPVTETKKGYAQTIVLFQPSVKDEIRGFSSSEQYFQIEIWDKDRDSKKFLKVEHTNAIYEVECYLNGERFIPDGKPAMYFNKLRLSGFKIVSLPVNATNQQTN